MTANHTESNAAGTRGPAFDQPYPNISFKEAYVRMFKKWRVFSGRASLAEYWWSVLYIWMVNAIFLVMYFFYESFEYALVGWLIVVIIPKLALTVRRLHDADMPGWWAALPWVAGLTGGWLTASPVAKVIIALGITDPVQFAGTAFKGAIQQIGGGSTAVVIIGILLMVVAVAGQIALGLRLSKPEGARWDK
ncbi:MAG: DUF805 domain-containing protein [Bifidobacterium merycicum]|uniref:Membrane protein n=1 Tax=Bifidobacterium merycicum TaxID=78345 RepID=A0A087BHT0_9BIFI|nr:DUF805 domain-containing protein [Bifidobacterium merycicum]MBQ1513835.1 DUF805 domain-containing protein [Bifidobacterium sp.]KFI70580.1 membrane protein [Bifidobacterium merycicum]MEE1293668.1 DUF805 domain-containing protein [Bifidobacterium merycicum]MEE3341880.1 DUF805 domain-containing protein [Bifidobacterium merycicum]SHE28083.1 Uncharacterized membrane protein YhaH, DUF805 family [Bifidobacterium merycicum DSM 6492]